MGKSRRLTGKLVTFEGTEGAGKSSLIEALVQLLTEQGVHVVRTREPGGSQVAEKIRSLILDHEMHPTTELFLYEAARSEHLHQTILPALTSGAVVLCDRFADSSLAYQGMARGLEWKTVHQLNAVATEGRKPDCTVLIDIDPAKGLRSATDPNRFEAEGVAFQKKVRQGFLKAMREDHARWIKITARKGTPSEMAAKLWPEIERRLGLATAKKSPAAKTRAKKKSSKRTTPRRKVR